MKPAYMCIQKIQVSGNQTQKIKIILCGNSVSTKGQINCSHLKWVNVSYHMNINNFDTIRPQRRYRSLSLVMSSNIGQIEVGIGCLVWLITNSDRWSHTRQSEWMPGQTWHKRQNGAWNKRWSGVALIKVSRLVRRGPFNCGVMG